MGCSLPGSSVHGDSPGKNTGVGCYALLQMIFPTLGSNPGLLHCRWILYQLSYHVLCIRRKEQDCTPEGSAGVGGASGMVGDGGGGEGRSDLLFGFCCLFGCTRSQLGHTDL